MFTKLRDRLQDHEDGFTLIELLVVVIIIGILAAIAIPTFLNQRERGYVASAESDVRNGAIAAETYFTQNGDYAFAVADLEASGFVSSDQVTLAVGAGAAGTFCLTADHALTAAAPDAVYDSDDGGVADNTAGC